MLSTYFSFFTVFLFWVPFWGNGKRIPDLARRCPVGISVKVVHFSLLETSIRFMQEYEWWRRRRENLGCYKGDGKPRTTN